MPRTARTVAVASAMILALAAACSSNRANELQALTSAEIFDPASGQWQVVASMNHPRQGHASTLLADGRVLVCGGRSPGGGFADNLNTAEIYDPRTDTWTDTGSLNDAREGHTATLLSDGRVLVVNGEYPQKGSSELYDPQTGKWRRAAPLPTPRDRHATVTLGDGHVLVTGGYCHPRNGQPVATAEVYDPATDAWTEVAPMTVPRTYHTMVVLSDGHVLVAGGENADGPPPGANLATAELYDPKLDEWQPVATMSIARAYGQRGGMLPDGSLLMTGGEPNPGQASNRGRRQATTEAYDRAADSWNVKARMYFPRNFHTLTVLADGSLLAAGGNDSRPLDAAERYDPAEDRWKIVALMTTPRARHAATLLGDGRVLASGGLGPAPQVRGSSPRSPDQG